MLGVGGGRAGDPMGTCTLHGPSWSSRGVQSRGDPRARSLSCRGWRLSIGRWLLLLPLCCALLRPQLGCPLRLGAPEFQKDGELLESPAQSQEGGKGGEQLP